MLADQQLMLSGLAAMLAGKRAILRLFGSFLHKNGCFLLCQVLPVKLVDYFPRGF
jgi:hypothetical protein